MRDPCSRFDRHPVATAFRSRFRALRPATASQSTGSTPRPTTVDPPSKYSSGARVRRPPRQNSQGLLDERQGKHGGRCSLSPSQLGYESGDCDLAGRDPLGAPPCLGAGLSGLVSGSPNLIEALHATATYGRRVLVLASVRVRTLR